MKPLSEYSLAWLKSYRTRMINLGYGGQFNRMTMIERAIAAKSGPDHSA